MSYVLDTELSQAEKNVVMELLKNKMVVNWNDKKTIIAQANIVIYNDDTIKKGDLFLTVYNHYVFCNLLRTKGYKDARLFSSVKVKVTII